MKNYGTFDILGPIMVGPSSSHTAGAARLAKIAKQISSEGFCEVEFLLHGSFASTYQGHGTDKALVAGILGMNPDDERLVNSFELAEKEGIKVKFTEADLGYEHPNTVKIIFKYKNKPDFYITGSSVGGGNIIITDIDGNDVEFTGSHPTILLRYKDKKGFISKISSILANNKLNIATLNVSRDEDIATLVCELDSEIKDTTIDEIKDLEDILFINFINPMVR